VSCCAQEVYERAAHAAEVALSKHTPDDGALPLHLWQNMPLQTSPFAPAGLSAGAGAGVGGGSGRAGAAAGAGGAFVGAPVRVDLNLKVALWQGNLLSLKMQGFVCGTDGDMRHGRGMAVKLWDMTGHDATVKHAAENPLEGCQIVGAWYDDVASDCTALHRCLL
jgi:hypothetical protein